MKNLKSTSAKEIMTAEILSVEPTVTVQEAAELMTKNNIGALVVLSPIRDLLGIFTERDLLRRVVAKKKDPTKTKIQEVMTPNVMVAQASDNAWDLMQVMNREKLFWTSFINPPKKSLCRLPLAAAFRD